jgi:hypothetical protein
MGRIRRLLRRPAVIAVLIVGLAGAGFGMYWYQPWKLVVDERVNEPPPTAAATPSGETSRAAAPQILAAGEFISHEHTTTGTVQVLRLADERLVLRLEDLDTSNGPDLKVWLTDAPVLEGREGWKVFDEGAYVSLGKLKGNKGSQNYDLPADTPLTDLTALTSVSVWCERFGISFGAAALDWTPQS